MSTLVEILKSTEAWLDKKQIPSPRLEAEILLSHVLSMKRLSLYMNYDRPLVESELKTLRQVLSQRGERVPLAWITGTQGFHAITLSVHPNVLVPRPDTETLVESVIAAIDKADDPLYIAEPCCGTGAVGLALAHAIPNALVYCSDISPEAIANTKENVTKLQLTDRVAVLHGDMLNAVPTDRKIDIVVCNPPYIPTADIPSLEPEVSRHEPKMALDGGADGLDYYRALIPSALQRGASQIHLEVGHDQADDVITLLTQAGFSATGTMSDLGGHRRVVYGTQSESS